MRLRFTAFLLLFISTIIVSCSKDETTPDEQQNPGASSLFVRVQQGIIPGDDSVYLVSYDSEKRISNIIDSTSGGTLTPTYSAEGNLSAITDVYEEYSDKTTFSYNGDNQLTEVNFDYFSPTRFTFEYTNGIISRKNYYIQTSVNSPMNLWRYYTYELTDGNITSIKEYNNAGTLLGETTFTYTTDPNIFKSISLINFMNYLGLSDLANEDYFFNKNLIASSTVANEKTTYTYTYNDNKQLVKIVVSSPRVTHTRMLSY